MKRKIKFEKKDTKAPSKPAIKIIHNEQQADNSDKRKTIVEAAGSKEPRVVTEASMTPPPPSTPNVQTSGLGENFPARDVSLEMEESYIDYAMSVIVARALPDVRDG